MPLACMRRMGQISPSLCAQRWSARHGRRRPCRLDQWHISRPSVEATAVGVRQMALSSTMRRALRKAVPWLLAEKRSLPPSQSENSLRRIRRNLVVIKFSQTLPFDGDGAGASEATGFVVDARRGYTPDSPRRVAALTGPSQVYRHQPARRRAGPVLGLVPL